MDALQLWMDGHHDLMWWFVGGSAALLVVGLIAVPLIVMRLPADYFTHPRHGGAHIFEKHPAPYWTLLIAKNLFGVLLVLLGLLLLVLPGQGVLMIIAGLMLMNFPGKYRLERWLVTRRPVWRAIQWLRQVMHKPRMVL